MMTPGSMGGGAYGNSAGKPAPNGPAGSFAVMKDAEGRDVVAGTVRQVGKKTFFRKGERWVDSTVKPEEDAKATVIEQFSPAYFDLARNQTPEMNQYLSFEESVTVNINGKVYRIDQAKK